MNNKDVILESMYNMEIKDLYNFCKTNKNIYNICKQYKNNIFTNILKKKGYTHFNFDLIKDIYKIDKKLSLSYITLYKAYLQNKMVLVDYLLVNLPDKTLISKLNLNVSEIADLVYDCIFDNGNECNGYIIVELIRFSRNYQTNLQLTNFNIFTKNLSNEAKDYILKILNKNINFKSNQSIEANIATLLSNVEWWEDNHGILSEF